MVSLADVLEHMPYPKLRARGGQAAAQAGRCVVPVDAELRLPALAQARCRGTGCPYWSELEHFHNFGRARLYALLAEMGFTPLRYGVSLRYVVGMEIIAQALG